VQPGVLETIDKITGVKQIYAIPKQWKNDSSRVDQVIDLLNIDTTQTAYKYRYWRTIPIGAGESFPMIISDFNENDLPELSGIKAKENGQLGANSAIYEMQPDSSWMLRKKYEDKTTNAVGLKPTDLDGDGLMELNFHFSPQFLRNYESSQQNRIPDSLNFTHQMWDFGGEDGHEIIVNLDQDNLMELVYLGDDTLPPVNRYKLFIAEYKPGLNNFKRVYRLVTEDNQFISGITCGDIDQDGKMEIIAGSGLGNLYVIECNGDDHYSLINTDTLNMWNPYLCAASNDIDHNGKPEFFIGGHNFIDGHLVDWYESDGDNNYIIVHSLLIKNTDLFFTNNLQAVDVDLDGTDELVFTFAKALLILKYNTITASFDVFYVKTIYQSDGRIRGSTLGNVIDSAIPELMVSIRYNATNYSYIRTQIYRTDFITGIKFSQNNIQGFTLLQNYPNPLNNSTHIGFHIRNKENINLSVYDITGKEVIELIKNKQYIPGEYFVTWNGRDKKGKEVSSGIYLYVLNSSHFRTVKKMVLLR